MAWKRIVLTFLAIGVGALLLAAAGRFLLAWPAHAVRTWVWIGAAYLGITLLLLLAPRWWRNHCDELATQPAQRRYVRAMWPIMVGYALLIFCSAWLIQRGIPSVGLRALVALLPMVPLALFLVVSLRYLRNIDELQRRIETEAIGIASLLVSLGYFAGGLLHVAKAWRVDAGAAMLWVFPLLCGVYGIAKMVLTRRYL